MDMIFRTMLGFLQRLLVAGPRLVAYRFRCGHVWFREEFCSYLEGRRIERVSRFFSCGSCAARGFM